MTKEKPGCQFCQRQGHVWSTPEGKSICFECLRSQRNEYRDLAARQAEELAALQEQRVAALAEYEVSMAHVVRQRGDLEDANRALQAMRTVTEREKQALPPAPPAGLRSDLLALHETTGQLLAKLSAGRDEEKR